MFFECSELTPQMLREMAEKIFVDIDTYLWYYCIYRFYMDIEMKRLFDGIENDMQKAHVAALKISLALIEREVDNWWVV